MRRAVREKILPFSALACLLACEAWAQCLFEFTADLSPPIGADPGVISVKTVGTFDCAALDSGSTCSSGTISGTCAENEGSAFHVSCNGGCAAVFGATADSVGCSDGPEDEVGRGTLSTVCRLGTCVTMGSDNGQSFAALSTVEPGEFLSGSDQCAPGGPGVSRSKSRGILLVTPVP
jgi:hypothetical protein